MDESGPIEVVGVIDLERVQTKLDYVEREAAAAAAGAARLRQLRVPPAEDVEAAATMLRGVKYALQTSIQAMIDVAYHLAAKAFGSAPADAYEAFAVLARRGAIPCCQTRALPPDVGPPQSPRPRLSGHRRRRGPGLR